MTPFRKRHEARVFCKGREPPGRLPPPVCNSRRTQTYRDHNSCVKCSRQGVSLRGRRPSPATPAHKEEPYASKAGRKVHERRYNPATCKVPRAPTKLVRTKPTFIDRQISISPFVLTPRGLCRCLPTCAGSRQLCLLTCVFVL